VIPNQPGPRGASVGFAERLLEVIDSGRRTATYKLALLIALLDLCARHSDAARRAPRLLYTRDITEQVAVLYWPQVIPYLVPGAGAAVGLRQITLPRAAIIAAVSAFRRAADAAGAPSWHLARQRLPWAYQVMLDQVEVTVAQQPLPRLQAVGSTDTVFPFIYELDWGPRESFSVARRSSTNSAGGRGSRFLSCGCAAMVPGALRSGCCPAPAMSSSGSGRWSAPWLSCTGPGWSPRSTRWPPPSWACTVTCSARTGSCPRRHCETASPRCRRAGASTVIEPSAPPPGRSLHPADPLRHRRRREPGAGRPAVQQRQARPATRAPARDRRNQRHGVALTRMATASRWDTDPAATTAVARSIYSHLPPGGTPLWLGFKDVGNADPAIALA
jgi:hypothetical protein